MLIACKYAEIWAPEVSDFVNISVRAYAREHILVMEKMLLGKLEWYLTVPTPYVFIVRYSKASVEIDNENASPCLEIQQINFSFFSAETKSISSRLAETKGFSADSLR